MRDELGLRILTKFVGLGAITFNYLIDYSIEDKETKSTKECVIKKLNLEIIKTV